MNDFFVGVANAILLAICGFFLAVHNTQAADLFVQAGLGETIFIPQNVDGTWFDSNLPHQFHMNDVAFRAAVGVQFTPELSATIGFTRLGRNSIDSLAVSDACFARRCTSEMPSRFHVVDHIQGAEFAGIYTFQIKPVQPYVRAGLLVGSHTISVDVTPTEGPRQHVDFSGTFLAPFVGVGVKWKYLWADVSYYRIRADAPPAASAIVPMIGGRYEF